MSSSVGNLRLDLIKQHKTSSDIIRLGIRPILMNKIQDIILKILRKISSNAVPYLESMNFTKFDNCVFEERLRLRDSKKRRKRIISFGNPNTRLRFSVIIFLMSKIHKLLASGRTNTRRELYYSNLNMFKSQKEVDEAMIDICYIVDAPSWELGIMATSKGMVAGPLIFKTSDEIVDCNRPGGVLIPQNILEMELISNNVQWALVIEKDASFQNILDGNGLKKFKDCLFVTGKGYPDISTRLLLCRLWESFQIPILALVDADPYGLEIMSMYRFGSLRFSPFSDRLACPSLRWLGIHPSEINPLCVDSSELSPKDVRRLSLFANRPYVRGNEKLMKEIQILIEGNRKAEIEDISNISTHYLTDVYIPSKLHCGEFI